MNRSLLKKIIIVILVLAVIILAYTYFSNGDEVEFITEEAEIQDIEQVVSVNGTVESHSKIELRFQQSGKLESLNFEVGETVYDGDVLANIENDRLEIEVEKAQSNVNLAQADLDLRYAGPPNEEIRISQMQIEEAQINLNNSKLKYSDVLLGNAESLRKADLEIDNANITLANAEKDLESTDASSTNSVEIAENNLEDAYEDSDTPVLTSVDTIKDALTAADSILGIDNTSANDSFDDRLGDKEPGSEQAARTAYADSKLALENLEQQISSHEEAQLTATKEELRTKLDTLLLTAEMALFTTKDLLDKTYNTLDATITNYKFTAVEQETLKTKISLEQTSINTSLQSIVSIIQTIQSAKLELTRAELTSGSGEDDADAAFKTAENNLKIAESNRQAVLVQSEIDKHTAQMQIDLNEVMLRQSQANYANVVADPRYVDVAGLHARLDNAKASLRQSIKQVEDSQIVAPIKGVITEINSDIGENIAATQDTIIMQTDKLQIAANISETDINKISIGDPAAITFDSLPVDEIFTGKVVSINPAETVIQGVIYYEATILLEIDDDRIKSGMTADMDILTASAESVVAVPSLSVEYDNGDAYVYILNNGVKEKRVVKVGVEGEINIEVREGVELGENVIIYEK